MNGSWTWYGDSTISILEDHMFGFYGTQARNWDIIANNAPYYLICKSAGNDRNEGPADAAYPKDGPYDCIADGAVAKNVLTIGAVYDIPNGYTQSSDVVMTNFSGWGPVDDGRIKPDLVASGISVYSATSTGNAAYSSMSGTSMSTPVVSGSLLLLQQHYHNLWGQHMLAATLKALAIHTADEAGTSTGPDYRFGWGLMNTLAAAQKITEDTSLNVIEELVLQAGNTYSRSLFTPGNSPLKVTVVWNDPAGNPSPALLLDPTAANLINDLNVKLTRNGISYYPWKLNPASPDSPATRNAVNHADNVVQVLIDAPTEGIYSLVVDYEGLLTGGSQQFSVIISGLAEMPDSSALTTFNGTLSYANAMASPLNNACLTLKQGSITEGLDTTNMNGSFSFNNLQPGTYLLGGTSTSPWGGVNATDALMIVKHFMHINYLSGLNLNAADVDGNGYVNSIDAMLASRRFAGLITSFNAGDWVFQHDSAVISGTGVVTKNYKAIIVGDVDGSYTPGAKESAACSMMIKDEINCSPGDKVSVPVKISSNASIGAMSLVINIPDGIKSVTGFHLAPVSAVNENLVYHVDGRQLKIAWFSIDPMIMTSGETLCYIDLEISRDAGKKDFIFSMEASGSMADENAVIIPGLSLTMPKLNLCKKGFVLGQNVPNPCKGLSTIAFHTEQDALVRLKVFNSFGQCTESRMMEVTIGSHSLELNTAGYAPGTYYYQLEADDNGYIHRETRKMLVAQ